MRHQYQTNPETTDISSSNLGFGPLRNLLRLTGQHGVFFPCIAQAAQVSMAEQLREPTRSLDGHFPCCSLPVYSCGSCLLQSFL